MSRFVPAKVQYATGKPEHPPEPPKPRERRQFRLPKGPVIGAFVGVLVLGGLLLYRSSIRPAPQTPETNAGLAHDPTQPRRPIEKYDETLSEDRYVNQDLGVSVSVPQGWKTALGERPRAVTEHEGLLVRMEPDLPLDEETRVRPLVSVVRRDAPKDQYPDALAYIRARLMGAGKTVIEEPRVVELNGQQLGRAVFEMKSGDGHIRILQLVRMAHEEAIIASAMAPRDQFPEISGVFDQVTRTMRLGQ